MMNAMKEMNQKKVGGYRLHLFHIDSDTGAMKIYVHNSEKLAHDTGAANKMHVMKLFQGLNTRSKVEGFLKAAQREQPAMLGGFGHSVRY